ncbi:hypothetical protein PQ456_02530 [Paenibacillus kyungheensis]|uniref:DUF4825 domain-containing protein n=1 Tax=Paenibacillus kyungheensis TaxID=1452732 RepID=A0AAX3M4C1_9BACL|nr:hypothetical protein [Paenibacillus kyungheensis]WCT56429.1 hypothetical protein PQ456_02530 [Paenibacillus kyungheensis]
MKKSFRSVIYVILIIILTIVVINFFNSAEIKNRMFPNTTFKKEVTEKIENKEISSLLLMDGTENEDVVTLKNRADIDYILDSLAVLNLKKVSESPDTSKEDYYINIKGQTENLFSLILSDSKYMVITDFKNNSVQQYEIENDFDLNKIKKFFGNGNKNSPSL